MNARQKQNSRHYLIIVDGLSRANLVVCNKVDPESIGEMALVFFDELERFPPQQIEAAFRKHIRESRYMPTLAEIYSVCERERIIREQIEQNRKAAIEERAEQEKYKVMDPVSAEKMREDIQAIKNKLKGAMVVPSADIDIDARKAELKRQAAQLLSEESHEE